MTTLIFVALAGLAAQFIDGALGMGYGVSSSTLLLAIGLTPATASASVHLAELATCAASGISHFRFHNIDRGMVLTLAVPGAVGAFLGAVVLTSLSGVAMKMPIAFLLLALGVYILLRYFKSETSVLRGKDGNNKVPWTFLAPLGLVAGVVDAMGGGGWGPIATPVLTLRPGMEPRKAIGSVDTSEFFVALGASMGFLFSLSRVQVNWYWVMALVMGGVIAAPLAAYTVSRVPLRLTGILVGGMVILTNLRTLLRGFGVESPTTGLLYLLVGALVAVVLAFGIKRLRDDSAVAGLRQQLSD